MSAAGRCLPRHEGLQFLDADRKPQVFALCAHFVTGDSHYLSLLGDKRTAGVGGLDGPIDLDEGRPIDHSQSTDLPPGTSPPSKLDPEPFEVHPRG